MPPLLPGKGGLKSILAGQVTSGAVEGSNTSPRTSKGSIPRPFQRPNLSIHSANIEAAGYPLEVGPKFGTWPFPIKEGQGLGLQIEAKDAFGHPKGKIWPSPRSIPRASALEVITTPVNPLLDPRPGPSLDPTDQIIKGLEYGLGRRGPSGTGAGPAGHPFIPTSSHRSLPLPPSVSRQMQRLQLEMANSHPKSAFLALEAKGQPSSHLCRWRQVGTVPPPSSHAPTASSWCGDGG
ncbi:hypothetical protein PAXRUDRAFT_22464 [Paxillus rubicundulus Ve08.2h10]|uniref:Uncharacterized protein n=1 Tax=Paxillus rubicundulus Ve08.2h10 TaxID=930991 RepID=A0A0D0D5E0_9AGAM|nr:hypothetical protein PAXRUDRAFT_22464 [Paxillus rubicundulus Ve08.2h10]